jgi:hypothetical protein
MQQTMIADGTLACTPKPTLVGRKPGCGTPSRDLSKMEIEHIRWNGQGPERTSMMYRCSCASCRASCGPPIGYRDLAVVVLGLTLQALAAKISVNMRPLCVWDMALAGGRFKAYEGL